MALPPREAYVREHSSPAERADSQLRIESSRGPTNPERLHLQFTHSSPPTPLHPLHRKDQSPPVLLFIRKASDRGPLSGRTKPVLEAGGKGKTQPHFQARRERHLITSPLVCLFVPEDRHLSFVHSDLSRSVFFKDTSLYGRLSGRSSSRVHGYQTPTDTPDRQIDRQPHTHSLSIHTYTLPPPPPPPCRPS